MRRCKITIENIPGSPYSPSMKHNLPMLDREDYDAYDERTWREHCTVNKDGQVCIPAMGIKQSIGTAGYKLGMKVEGRRGATFKNFLESGFMVDRDAPIANGKPLTKEDAVQRPINANADGVRGSGKRVTRRFPEFQKYQATIDCTIIDDIITREVFEAHVKAAGMVCGIGRFRPEKGGTNGRFRVVKTEWEDVEL